MDALWTKGMKLLLAFSLLNALPSPAQSTSTIPFQFEVATIKPVRSSNAGGGIGNSPTGRFTARNQTLEDLVWFAYRGNYFHKGLVSGGPQWINSEHFDIDAKASGLAAPAQLQLMLRSLLADRFKLKMHEETKQVPVYALVVARSDARTRTKLRPTSAADAAYCTALETSTSEGPAERNADGTRRCGGSSRGGLKIRARPISELADMLSELMERTVIDKTGLTGRFDLDLDATLNWEHLVEGGGPADTLGVNNAIFTGLQEQLGLKLESTRGPVQIIVIDSAERPSEN